MRRSVRVRRRAEQRARRRAAIILNICGVLEMPLGIAMLFIPACDWWMGLLAFLQGFFFFVVAGYME